MTNTEMTYTEMLLRGLAELLDAEDVAAYTESGDYGVDDWGIWFNDIPENQAKGLTISRYLDLPGAVGTNKVMVQIRTRGTTNPFDGERRVDEIRDCLHRRTHVQLRELRFNLIEQKSFAKLSNDANGRTQHTQNFLLTGNRGTRI